MIGTNKEGHYTYTQVLRALNDITRKGPNDPSYDPLYDNRPIIPVEAFDDQSTFTSSQAGYLFMDFNYIDLVCKRGFTGQPNGVPVRCAQDRWSEANILSVGSPVSEQGERRRRDRSLMPVMLTAKDHVEPVLVRCLHECSGVADDL